MTRRQPLCMFNWSAGFNSSMDHDWKRSNKFIWGLIALVGCPYEQGTSSLEATCTKSKLFMLEFLKLNNIKQPIRFGWLKVLPVFCITLGGLKWQNHHNDNELFREKITRSKNSSIHLVRAFTDLSTLLHVIQPAIDCLGTQNRIGKGRRESHVPLYLEVQLCHFPPAGE